MTVTSRALVATDRPARYGKQLMSHMSRRVDTQWDEETGIGRAVFGQSAVCTLTSQDDGLHLELVCEPGELDRLEDVVGRHLVRFGTRDELVCAWGRNDGTAGTTQSKPDDDSHWTAP